MKPLFSAILETIVLVVATVIVMLLAHFLHVESDYANYYEKNPNGVITLGEVIKLTPDDADTPKEASIAVAQKFFGKKTDKVAPAFVGKILSIKLSEKTAGVLEGYSVIVFISSILCLIFGITLPCSLYRHLDPAGAIDEALIDTHHVYEDGYGRQYGYVGETRAGILKFIVFFLMLFVANVWCSLLPIFIVANLVVGIVMAILRIIGLTTSSAATKAKMKLKAGSDDICKYRLIVENNLFAVAGDVRPNRRLYFRQYWNAVIAQRILECDRDGRNYEGQDAIDTIHYGDENVHKRFKTVRRVNKIKLLFSSKARKNAKKYKNEVVAMDYTFAYVKRQKGFDEYIIKSKCGDNYILLNQPRNCALMVTVMKTDSQNIVFAQPEWSEWCMLDTDGIFAITDRFAGRIDPPQGE